MLTTVHISFQILSVEFSSTSSSLKAASSVYVASAVFSVPEEWWTPTLQHHSGPSEWDVAPMALAMLRKGLQIQRAVQDGTAREKHRGITRKFRSVSRHQEIILKEGELIKRVSTAYP